MQRTVPSRARLAAALEESGDTPSIVVLWKDGNFSVKTQRDLMVNKVASEAIGCVVLDLSFWPFIPTRQVTEYLDRLYNELVGLWEEFWASYKATRLTFITFLPTPA